mmetsp:Transcript_8111/g.17483  ORF Transcript_8111/g.17483 Transcript_8111/m.17483 type:complete len:271 (-) Transcript_8111:156-968(-)|eukprot:CAMPEP_0185843970 /NCGR_PEP_ID=MMETSP1354-20130828/314_1 /TAXON_ID=708628 /ORGANISM="Erythrolobus madagascarensis, Strain CCMP3276" /LENGTH=270 /DNA_ID=CAMNT_0028543569 /DNA_START=77 /DNA_END=889 /DNA_ORIENTATION=+
MQAIGFVNGVNTLQLARPVRASAGSICMKAGPSGRRFSGFGRGLFGGRGEGANGNKRGGGSGGGANGAGRGGRGDNSSRFSGEGDSSKGGNPLVAFWNAYNSQLAARPILIKALTSLVGFALGDILAQSVLNKDEEFDSARLLRMALFGLLVHGPTGHFFYGAMDRAIPGTEAWKVVTKVAIDQIAWAPIFTVGFFTFIGLLEGNSTDQIIDKIKADTWTGVTGSWRVWPIVHAINFRFIPTSQRLLYINSIQILYNVFLSFIGNKSGGK